MPHNTLPQMSQVLRERAIGMLTAGMSTRAVAIKFDGNFSTISRLQHFFLGNTGPMADRVWQFADVNVVNRVLHCDGGIMV